MANTDVTREKLLQEFNEVVSDTEQLLKSIAAGGGEKAQALKSSVEENLRVARQKLAQFEQTAIERARVAARRTDEYVHENPWQSVAVVAGVAAVVGIVIGLLLNRHD